MARECPIRPTWALASGPSHLVGANSRPRTADLKGAATMLRIDTHHHAIPAFYRDLLQKASIDESGGRMLPEWSPEGSLQTMAELDVGAAILSVSTPGTAFLPSAADAA